MSRLIFSFHSHFVAQFYLTFGESRLSVYDVYLPVTLEMGLLLIRNRSLGDVINCNTPHF